MASVTKRQNSQYFWACFRDKNGRQKMRSTGLKDRGKAMAIANGYEAAFQGKRALNQIWKVLKEAAGVVDDSSLNEVTLQEYLGIWLAAQKNLVDDNTHNTYTSRNRSILKVAARIQLEKRPLLNIAKKDLARWRDEAAPHFSPRTVNLLLSQLKRVFEEAHSEEIIPDDPCAKIEPVAIRTKGAKADSRRPFTFPELRMVFSSCVAKHEEWASIVMFGLYTGQRLGDVVSIRWRDVDILNSEVRFISRKTKAVVIIPMAEALRNFILKLKAGDDPNAMVHAKAYAIYERDEFKVAALSNDFADILIDARLRKPRDRKAAKKSRRTLNSLSFHSLRHTLVSLLKNAGVSSAIVEDIVGHESSAVSQLYTHIDPKAKEAAMRKLPSIDFTEDLF